MLLGTERDFVALRYAILKFLTVNLFLCGSEPIFFCLEYISVFYKIMIKRDFLLAQITFFASIVIWFTIPRYFPQRAHVKESVAIFEGPHVFGQFRLVSSVPMSEGCQVVSLPFFEVSGLPDECGHLQAIRNRAVAIKRCITSEAGNYLSIA